MKLAEIHEGMVLKDHAGLIHEVAQVGATLVNTHVHSTAGRGTFTSGWERPEDLEKTVPQEDPISFGDDHYNGPERRRDMQQWDKLKLHAALMADALLHPGQYNQAERDALVAHFHAIASRL